MDICPLPKIQFSPQKAEAQTQQQLKSAKGKSEGQSKPLEAIIEVIEKDRARLSAYLHDDLGALLASVKLDLQNSNNPNQAAINHLNDAINKVRRISQIVKPKVLQKYGLKHAILDLIKESSGRVDHWDEVNLSEEQGLILFRIIQECLKMFSVPIMRCADDNQSAIFTITNQEGLADLSPISEQYMKSLAEIINAEIHFSRSQEQGLSVKLVIPLD